MVAGWTKNISTFVGERSSGWRDKIGERGDRCFAVFGNEDRGSGLGSNFLLMSYYKCT